jgi:hypothetical protein
VTIDGAKWGTRGNQLSYASRPSPYMEVNSSGLNYIILTGPHRDPRPMALIQRKNKLFGRVICHAIGFEFKLFRRAICHAIGFRNRI